MPRGHAKTARVVGRIVEEAAMREMIALQTAATKMRMHRSHVKLARAARSAKARTKAARTRVARAVTERTATVRIARAKSAIGGTVAVTKAMREVMPNAVQRMARQKWRHASVGWQLEASAALAEAEALGVRRSISRMPQQWRSSQIS